MSGSTALFHHPAIGNTKPAKTDFPDSSLECSLDDSSRWVKTRQQQEPAAAEMSLPVVAAASIEKRPFAAALLLIIPIVK